MITWEWAWGGFPSLIPGDLGWKTSISRAIIVGQNGDNTLDKVGSHVRVVEEHSCGING